MNDDSEFLILREKVQKCIKFHLNKNTQHIPVNRVYLLIFYDKIKKNYPLGTEERVLLYCEIISGLYKPREKEIYIKIWESNSPSLLLGELLHSISILRDDLEVEDWIKERLTRYLARDFCLRCNLEYKDTFYDQKYFSFWQEIENRYGLDRLIRILFANDINISRGYLKNTIGYTRDDVFYITFEKAKITYYF